MSLDSEQEDLVPLHPGNVRAIPSTDARVTLMNLPKEQSGLNGLAATVLSQAAAKSSSGAIKLLVKLDVDGKRVSIPESMCQKILDKLLVVNNAPMDIYIAPRDPMHKVLTEATRELGGHCVQSMSPSSIMIASPEAVASAHPSGYAVVSSTWLVRLVRSGVYVAPTEYRVDAPPAPKTPVAAAKSEPKTPAKQAAAAPAPVPAPAPAPAPAPPTAAAPAPSAPIEAAIPAPSTPAAASSSGAPPGVTPMKHAELMTHAQRKNCLQSMNDPAHREPFSKLEIRAQVSFVFDNPTLPLQSRKTWEQFRSETGSKRAADSLKSVCSTVAFLSHINSVKNPGGQSSLLQKLGVTPAMPSTPAKFAQDAAAAAPPPPVSSAEAAAAASPSRVIIQDSQLPQPAPARTPAKAPAPAAAAPASAQKRARSPPPAPAPAPAAAAAPIAPAAPAPVSGFPPPSAPAAAPAPAIVAASDGDMTHVHKRMRAAAVEQVVRDLAIQSSCSIAVVTHALIVSSGDVALARRYLVNSEKVVDEMLLMTYEQDKWLIQHGKQQQQAALDGAPVALVSDADAIKLQNIGRRVVNGRSLWLNDGK